MLAVGIFAVQLCAAQAPAGAPAGSTGLCKDGSYYNGPTKSGACSGHKGVKQFWGAANKSASTPAPVAASKPAPPPAAASKPAPAPTSAPPSAASAKTSTMAPAPGGGADKVWVNTASNVYHCPTDRYYGKTKAGAYMSESDARAKGAHPAAGKACK